MMGFLMGAISGAVATYIWRKDISRYMGSRVPDMRERAAERLGTVGERAGAVLDRARTGLQSGVRAGQERLRRRGDQTRGSASGTGGPNVIVAP